MVDYNSVTLATITEDQLKKMYNDFQKDETSKNLNFGNNCLYGIFYGNILVGLIGLCKWYSNDLTITIAILNEYRGIGIAPIAINKIVDLCGKKFPEIHRFICNVSPNEISSNRAIQKLNIHQTHEFDENMIEEGGEFFHMYYKTNPYYIKKDGKKR